jgi:hypothetical protein
MIEVQQQLPTTKGECDSCGKQFPTEEADVLTRVRIGSDSSSNRQTSFLCNKCADDLYTMLEEAAVS